MNAIVWCVPEIETSGLELQWPTYNCAFLAKLISRTLLENILAAILYVA